MAPWIMKQQWCDVLFMHWRVPADQLAALLPDSLELELFDGSAWIGVIPFRMRGIRWRWLPPIPGTSAFPELNVRTYVRPRGGGKPGVYFFSLEAANALAVKAARRWFHLPYFHAAMSIVPDRDGFRYQSSRVHAGAPRAEFAARYEPCGPVWHARDSSLDHWLVERYCLYASDAHAQLWRGDILHDPWPLQSATASIAHNTVAPVALPDEPPLLHFSKHVNVRVWGLQRPIS